MNRKHVLLYDFLKVKGGAEAWCYSLMEEFPEMRLIVSSISEQFLEDDSPFLSRTQNLSGDTSIPGWQTLKSCLQFKYRNIGLNNVDTAVYSGSNAPLAILKEQARNNIYYCHTPPRFVYDLRHFYLSSIPKWQQYLLKTLINWYQPQYEASIDQMDTILVNSQNVRNRVKDYLSKDSFVVYPPVETNQYHFIESGDFYLSTARLEDYKRIELIVRAFIKMPDKKLVVASGGTMLASLKNLAAESKNIHFTGWLTKQELIDLVGRCRATIYIPRDEDFGISPVESMAAGKPVIGAKEGGLLETVIDNETGWLIDQLETPDAIIKTISQLTSEGCLAMRSTCQLQAAKFSREQFNRMMREYI